MDESDVAIRRGELDYKRRGQTIAAWLTPALIVLLGVFIYLTMDTHNQVEALKTYLTFVASIAGLFVVGRVMSGLENIFGKKGKNSEED